ALELAGKAFVVDEVWTREDLVFGDAVLGIKLMIRLSDRQKRIELTEQDAMHHAGAGRSRAQGVRFTARDAWYSKSYCRPQGLQERKRLPARDHYGVRLPFGKYRVDSGSAAPKEASQAC